MSAISIFLGGFNILCGVVVYALCVPLARKLIIRNDRYGFRFRQAMESDEAWKAINEFGAKKMQTFAVAIMVIGLILVYLPIGTLSDVLLGLFVPGLFIFPCIKTWMFARNWKKPSTKKKVTEKLRGWFPIETPAMNDAESLY